MISKNSLKKLKWFSYIHWKKKDTLTIFLIISIGLILTPIGYLFSNFYDIFFSLCLGLFIGGIILTIISLFFAQMESDISGDGEIDFDIDSDIDVDLDLEAEVDLDIDSDLDIGAEVSIDTGEIDAEIDMDAGVEVDIDTDLNIGGESEGEIISGMSDITPAPIMLLFSAGFLVFGITGIIFYQSIIETLRFIILFLTPLIAYIVIKAVNFVWKIISKSQHYTISSTINLIGKKGEVILPVDDRGGVIKITSNTPVKFEKLHVKPLTEGSNFDRGELVYICDVKNGYLLVDLNKKLIKRRGI